jgi:hypothetical protein
MYEHGIPGFIEFAAKTTTLAEFLFAAVQCVSLRLLISSPIATTTTARVAEESNRKSQSKLELGADAHALPDIHEGQQGWR